MAFDQIPKKDWYSILGADPSATVSDLKQKYQKLILMVSLLFSILCCRGKIGFFLCDQKYRFLYHEYVISKQESKVLIWLIESFSSSVKKKVDLKWNCIVIWTISESC